MSYCSGSPDPASPIAANFTEFAAEGSANSWAVTLHHAEMTRSSVVRSRVTHLRSIGELAGRRFNRSRPTIGTSDKFWTGGDRERSAHHYLVTSSILARLSLWQLVNPSPLS